MEKSKIYKMAFALMQEQKTNRVNDQVSYVMLDSYVHHSSLDKEDIVSFLRGKKISRGKENMIALELVIFQIGRRGIMHRDKKDWHKYSEFFCKFINEKFLGHHRTEWVEFFLECCQRGLKKKKALY